MVARFINRDLRTISVLIVFVHLVCSTLESEETTGEDTAKTLLLEKTFTMTKKGNG